MSTSAPFLPDESQFRVVPFMWEPEETDGSIYEQLKNAQGEYECPWPDCDQPPSPAPQGVSLHMKHAHGWKTPLPSRPPKQSPAERISEARKRKTEKVRCGLEKDGVRCNREVRRDYLRGHLKEYHGLTDMEIPNAIATMQVRVTSNKPRSRKKEAEAELALKPLTAADICQAVLLEVAPNGSLPISALSAYQLWVAQTEAFLSLLLS